MGRITKLLIANRGEIAVRIMRTCREMGIKTVAVYSEVDRHMPHVQLADEACLIGPAPSRESYLAIDKIMSAATRSGADAIHPGYGFLAENEAFAQRVTDEGLIFVGPSPYSIRVMGDKTEARRLVRQAGVPIVPGTEGQVGSEAEAREFCARVGFPVLVKAAGGGGGKGMRVVKAYSELASSFRAAQSEALSAFGDGRIYLEKYLKGPRHIEFQIFADQFGNTIHLGERECTIQRRHQKIIEESPSVVVTDAMRQEMGNCAVLAAKAARYVNAGTIEFLLDANRNFYFLEMNTRLQVEHPITELRTGIDIVATQLLIAMGERLAFRQEDVQFRGHAIECRLYAEDPRNDFFPSTGTITHLRPSGGFGIREDRGVEAGGVISVYYDPMISKLCAWGRTREEALSRMSRALKEYEILGVRTNIPLNLFVLHHPKFVKGSIDTHFLEDNFKSDLLPGPSEMEKQAVACLLAVLANTKTPEACDATKEKQNLQSLRETNDVDIISDKNWKFQRLRNLH
jgi:acetyl-CoA carboxylase biotin carboxylase subunit